MAYNEIITNRIRQNLSDLQKYEEKKMFGGIAFMRNGNMCVGINKDSLMARVGAEQYQLALEQPFVYEMNFTGKPLKGFVYVDEQGIDTDKKLKGWIKMCEDFVDTLPAKKK